MKWQYKRIWSTGGSLITERGPGHRKMLDEEAIQQFDKQLNELGQDGWELVSSAVVYGFQATRYYDDLVVVEYIFKKPLD